MKPEEFDRIINAAQNAKSAHADDDVQWTVIELKRVAARAGELAGEASVQYATWLNEETVNSKEYTTQDSIRDGKR